MEAGQMVFLLIVFVVVVGLALLAMMMVSAVFNDLTRLLG